jgi:hypothetical protein
MHTYSTDAPDRRIAPVVIGAISVFMALGLSRIFSIANVSPPWWIDTPSVLGFYWPLWRIYDRWGWKGRLGAFPFSVITDFSGSWIGVVTSSYDSTVDVEATITVVQRWLSIMVTLETQWSRSYSIMAQIGGEASQEPGLKYVFRNQPRPLSGASMAAHQGIAYMRLSENRNELIGDYEAGMQRNTAGRMRFVRASS